MDAPSAALEAASNATKEDPASRCLMLTTLFILDSPRLALARPHETAMEPESLNALHVTYMKSRAPERVKFDAEWTLIRTSVKFL